MKQHHSIGKTLLQFFLSVLLVFSVLVGFLGLLGAYVLSSPNLLLGQLEKQQAAEKVQTQLESYFEEQAHATAVPAEVFLDSLDEEWVQNAMEAQIYSTYNQLQEEKSYSYIETDTSSLEQAVTAYFEDYAEENGYEKDESYTQKLDEVIQDAESEIDSAVDVYHLNTLQKAGLLGKLQTLTKLLTFGGVGGCILTALLLLGFILLREGTVFWTTAACFADGMLLGIPAVVVLGSGSISRFSLRDAAVYAVFTGTMEELVKIVACVGILLIVIDIALLCAFTFLRNHSKKAAEKQEQAETEA